MKHLLEVYGEKKGIIKKRLNDFSKVPEDEYFYELAFCLLTPQSKAKTCDKAVQHLKAREFHKNNINPGDFINNVRFNNNKAKYLIEMKQKFPEIMNVIRTIKNPEELRIWFVENVKGIGLKEAGHFLRNIGYRNLAILDRHILKNLKKFGVIEEAPKTLTKKNYFEIEGKFKEFSKKVNIPMDELDLLFWSMETGEIFK